MITPEASIIDVELTTNEEIETSKTYKLGEKIQGFVNGLEAVKQAIYKVLNTERYECPIYGFSYGIELESLIGKDPIYVQIELKRRIHECLLRDERITNVDNFQFETTGDEMLCTFDVTSIYGNLNVSKEVTT
ncbi:DUF2634 domain-containing protein [Sporanaerobacter sp. PP17-6a]|uniref:DUF2634 domain-containing protein n=1 Tax=Sporanaerobacter sp. PP17-6a TaxID=1891289 RepID=UPI0008A034A4|nr:DUF2634 domain-containing protein [Sporanaerobacter sp. PP17-6a]SCL85136.1 hypothetical protein PP176A_0814 [Sporanaerobacter sp. PP17-6a]